MEMNLTPREIVAELDRYIVGQNQAKKKVAIALRNRYRRQMLAEEMRYDVFPKNILMIGPTGVGKTEIARRLAKLVKAPFIKVEATKFTEVGYVGRDVESMIRDLLEEAIRMVRQEKTASMETACKKMAQEILLDVLLPHTARHSLAKGPMSLFGGGGKSPSEPPAVTSEQQMQREHVQSQLEEGKLEDVLVEIEIEEEVKTPFGGMAGTTLEDMGINVQDLFGSMLPKKKVKKKMKVSQARIIIQQQEAQKMIDMDQVEKEAIERTEEEGIVFLDEMDKIIAKDGGHGPDVSRGGVQRDILPIVEGATVNTRHGAVKTDHILFIGAGAFHQSKPSDLIPELQGRFPIRVELENLTRDDLRRILTQPRHSLIQQYSELLKIDNVFIEFTENAIDEIADIAYTVNDQTENIGARRLHTIMEQVLEDLLFDAPAQAFELDDQYIRGRLTDIVKNQDLSRYIL
jgi:ATP-dependent HslUV protease ATP-binding subunit HslU